MVSDMKWRVELEHSQVWVQGKELDFLVDPPVEVSCDNDVDGDKNSKEHQQTLKFLGHASPIG